MADGGTKLRDQFSLQRISTCTWNAGGKRHGWWDGIASLDDLLAFFKRLPNPDKQFKVMPGISHASFQQKNYLMVYHILHAFISQPEPMCRG